jgi:hypothetical protein
MRNSMIRQLLMLLLVLGPAARDAAGQGCPDVAKITAGQTGPMVTVRYLSDDSLSGRLAGTRGERCAGDYIASRFAAMGLKPAGARGTYFQEFPLASAVNPHAPSGTGRNVIAVLEGGDPLLKAEFIIVGAHYDHLGMGAFGSTSTNQQPAIHNGADDNASGVAAMLDIAARLARGPRPARSVLFMAFSGEESGLLGSAYFAANPTIALSQTRAMLNLDMVGRLGAGPLIVNGTGTATEWQNVINDAAAAQNLQLTLNPDGYGASDHTSFYLRDIPVLHFFTNVHSEYHNPDDDWEKIDAAGIEKVAAVVTTIAQRVASKDAALTLVKTPPPAPAQGGGYGAYLGTVPDFAPVKYGVKISGTRAGSPGDVAGMKAGDIIIRFDDEEIADLQAMTNALRKRKPGDAVRVTVLRDGKEVVLNATLGRRGS